MENKLVIRAHGFGFYILLFLYSMFVLLGIIALVLSITSKEDGFYSSWIAMVIYVVVTFIMVYEIVMLFKKGKVEFVGNEFINPGKYTSYFPPFKVNCADIISYELLSISIEFTFIDGKKKNFHTIQFSKKQNLQILQEIQKRGGLQNQEIKLDNYYFNTKFKSKKK